MVRRMVQDIPVSTVEYLGLLLLGAKACAALRVPRAAHPTRSERAVGAQGYSAPLGHSDWVPIEYQP